MELQIGITSGLGRRSHVEISLFIAEPPRAAHSRPTIRQRIPTSNDKHGLATLTD